LPNLRALHITDLVAHNGHFERFFEAIKHLARDLGCSRVRCAAKPAQARLYRAKCGFMPVYEILEVPS
jgi:N-acetylglutamate synthase-like GNAT family acetyltransferase